MKQAYQVPFDPKTGELMSYPESWRNPVWKDNFEWEDELEYETFGRGQSAVHIYMKSTRDGKHHVMFMTDFSDIVKELAAGKITGVFTHQKRGANYGVRIVR